MPSTRVHNSKKRQSTTGSDTSPPTTSPKNDSFYGSAPPKRVRTGDENRSPRSARSSLTPKSGSTLLSKATTKVPLPATIKHDSLVELSLGNFDTFPKQRLAIEKLIASRRIFKNSRIFSYETKDGTGGERRYLVTTLDRFWTWYEKQESRHMYELIYEDTPCRLYFDLEYSKVTNTDIDHQIVYDHFCSTLTLVMEEHFNISVTRKNMLVLDSSTPFKFSAHVICHLEDGLLFPSSASLRAVSDLLSKKLLHEPPVPIWNTDKTQYTTLFDSAVYTKNRNFRLFLSSKLGKEAVLRRADYCEFYVSKKVSDHQIFFDSLCVPVDYAKHQVKDLPAVTGNGASAAAGSSTGSGHHAPPCDSSKTGQGPSPLPQLDEFILMVLRKWSPQVYIRQWKTTENNGKLDTITYYPANCRYCFNIGRQHKSNGTYWTVNLARREFYQKCFDPECRGSSSNMFPLPSFIAETLEPVNEDAGNVTLSNEDVESLFENSHHEMQGFFTQWDQVFDS